MSKRLTDEQRAEVITDFAGGKTKSEIARKFKVNKGS
jgi:transposase-like protein